jgi:hypothetical protein
MRRIVLPVSLPLLGPICALTLLLVCFRAVLFGGEQFGYRDAGHFYYPLYLRIQQEWAAGRWPLWDPWQNAGMPLLGMPMSAVFYPGKILYAILDYPWATRLYAIAHVVIAWAGMFALARAWRLSSTAASLSAMAYAFGAPVLFQYCNVIYLVGAAWVPWGFLALEWLLHQKRRAGLLGLAIVLALQVLGGDPEAAYLTVLCGGGYALVLAPPASAWPARVFRMLGKLWVAALGILIWVAAVALAAYAVPKVSVPSWLPPGWVFMVVLWGGIGAWVLAHWRWQARAARLGPMLAALAGACALAVLLTAVQLLPTLEYSGKSHRAADLVTMDIYYFSVEPWRFAELLWPSPFGITGAENHSFFQALPRIGNHALWTPSLYLGGLTLALALGGARSRDGDSPPWRIWMLAVVGVAVVASCGRFLGPLWWLRWVRGVPGVLGPADPSGFVLRSDGLLVDGSGSPYGLLATVLPGFGLFRYPGKLMTFLALAVAGLAGRGWDHAALGRTRWPARWCAWGLAATALAGLVTTVAQPWIMATLTPRLIPDTAYGPIDLPAALDLTRRALIHGGVVLALGLGLLRLAPGQPRLAGVLAMVVLALDLGIASGRLIWTAPQSVFKEASRLAQLIADAERDKPSPGPFRIHRMALWQPEGFTKHPSPDRFAELIRWERNTLQPSHGLPMGFQYCLTQGVLELFDYLLFFRHQELKLSPEGASFLETADADAGRPVNYFPRRGFDLWNARYFILPIRTDNFKSADRGYAAFLPEVELIFPKGEIVVGPAGESWREHEDWQLFRNKDAYPRAWLVHFVRVRTPVQETSSTPRSAGDKLELMKKLVYKEDPFWRDPDRQVYDLRSMAFIETDQSQGLAGYVSRTPVGPGESVTVTRYEPQRVELAATLQHPGFVILADAYYPGWKLTIDGRPAPIYRTNRLMRGAAVKAGRHTLVYTYDPDSFRVGAALSIAGLCALAALVPWARHGSSRAGMGRPRAARSVRQTGGGE